MTAAGIETSPTATGRPQPEMGGVDREDGVAGSPAGTGPSRRSGPLLVATGAYLVLAVIVWWHIWSTHPTSVTTCGCGDSSLFTWFLEWPAYALSHGLDPFYSTSMFHPAGVNLLSNTSELAFGVLLAPVTWAFGPIATLNVALTLAPVLTASAMFWLLQRWVTWTPAAFAGGLLYGFSPLVLVSLTDAHLMVGMLAVPPLVVGCLDELLVRQRHRPVPTGVALALLIGVQFFIGTEVLTIMAMTGVVGVAVLLFYGALHPAAIRSRWRHAVMGLATAGGVAGIVLAYPVWFALAGPAHLSGAIWPNLLVGYGGTNFAGYVLPPVPSAGFAALTHRVGGYQGQTLSGQYFGFSLLGVVLVGSFVWRRDRRLWLFGVIGAVTVALSFGIDTHTWVPWRLLVRIPLIQNIVPSRFLSMTYLVAAILLALVADHAAGEWATWISRRQMAAIRTGPTPRSSPERRAARGAGVTGIVVSAIALVPLATYLGPAIPLTATPVVLPRWFAQVAPHLRGRQVLLAYPVPFSILQSAMTWQAVDRMEFSMAGGGGPEATLSRAGRERQGQSVIRASSFSFLPRPDIDMAAVRAVRQALAGWGVTMVVIPDQPRLPVYEQVASAPYAVGLITAATGERPVEQAGAWVWAEVNRAGAPAPVSSDSFKRCVDSSAGHPRPVAGVPGCILAGVPRQSPLPPSSAPA